MDGYRVRAPRPFGVPTEPPLPLIPGVKAAKPGDFPEFDPPPPPPETRVDYFTGLDLGQAQDFTALVVVERTREPAPTPDRPGKVGERFDVRHLHRWPLGTGYPAIVADVKQMFAAPPLARSALVVDQTGVGRPVVDMLRAAGIGAALTPYTITAGEAGGPGTVPKKNLVGAVQVPLQERRLRFAEQLELTPVLVRELEMFRVKVTTARNEQFECLVAGTLVETDAGPRPIEDIRPGERVLTRAGFRRVLWAGKTKDAATLTRVRFAGGAAVTGTPDHLIWTAGGWVPLAELAPGDACLGLTTQPPAIRCGAGTRRSSSSTARSTAARRAATTTGGPGAGSTSPCTGPCGSTTTGQFPPGTTSTTGTGTRTTTTCPTSSASRTPSTPGGTSSAFRPSCGGVGFAGPVSPAAGSAVVGTATRGSGSVRSGVRTPPGGPASASASSAAGPSSPPGSGGTGRWSGSAPPPAATVTGTSTTTGRPVPVYDLVVEDCHEFFANGVLVHNSWRERDHDDLVLALALALYVASRPGVVVCW